MKGSLRTSCNTQGTVKGRSMAGDPKFRKGKEWKFTFEEKPLGITVWRDVNGFTYLKKVKNQNVLRAGVTDNMYITSINGQSVSSCTHDDIKTKLVRTAFPLVVTFSRSAPQRAAASLPGVPSASRNLLRPGSYPRYRVTDKDGVITRRYPDLNDNSGACPIMPFGALLEVVQINDAWIKLRNDYWLHINFDGIEQIPESESSVSVSVEADGSGRVARALTEDQQQQLHLTAPPDALRQHNGSSDGYSQNNSSSPQPRYLHPLPPGGHQPPAVPLGLPQLHPQRDLPSLSAIPPYFEQPALRRSMTEEVVEMADGDRGDLEFLRHRQNILQEFRPCIRALLAHLVKYDFEFQGRVIHPYFRTYVYGGEAYMLYWEAAQTGPQRGGQLPFRRPLDVDVYVPIDVQDWTEPQRLERKQELFIQDLWRIWDKADVRSLADMARMTLEKSGHTLRGPYMSTAHSATHYKNPGIVPGAQGAGWARQGTPPIDNEAMYRKVSIEYYDGNDSRPVVLCDFQLKPRVSWGSWEDVYTMHLDRRSLAVTKMTMGDLPEEEAAKLKTIRVPSVAKMHQVAKQIVVANMKNGQMELYAPENRRRNPRYDPSRSGGKFGNGVDDGTPMSVAFTCEQSLGLSYAAKAAGVVVTKVSPSYQGAAQGVQEGWIVTAVDGAPVPAGDTAVNWVLLETQKKQTPYVVTFLQPIKSEVPIKAITDLSRRDWFIETFVKVHAPHLYDPAEVSDLGPLLTPPRNLREPGQ